MRCHQQSGAGAVSLLLLVHCFVSLTAWSMPAVGSQQPSQPPPPESGRTQWSQLRSWVCPENSKLLFSAQSPFECMKAVTVFRSNILLGAVLGNCSTA